MDQEHKRLKFHSDLVPQILSKEKCSTWRINDDKGLEIGDILDLIEAETNQHFATARVVQVIEKLIGEVNEVDFVNHEKFPSPEVMYRTYSNYYQKPVGPDTPLKIIDFYLL